MINYYSKKKSIPKDKQLIEFVDAFFDGWIIENNLTAEDEKLMQLIDNSKIAEGINRIITPFGVGTYWNISTGCKALILLSHLDDSYVVNIQECGQNVINYIFEKMNNINVYSSTYRALPVEIESKLYMNGHEVKSFKNFKLNWR